MTLYTGVTREGIVYEMSHNPQQPPPRYYLRWSSDGWETAETALLPKGVFEALARQQVTERILERLGLGDEA